MPYTKCSYDRLTTATPITAKITSIFKEHFQAKLTKPASKSGRLQLNYYEESVTSEEAVPRLRERERQKKERKKKRRNAEVNLALPLSRSQENLCQGCGKDYGNDTTDDQQCWTGCDKAGCDKAGCRRWYHYWCAMFTDMPDTAELWICPACS